MLDHPSDHGPTLSHLVGLSLHQVDICAHRIRQIAFVDDQQITASDSWTTFSGHLVPTSDVNHIDDEVGQLAAVVRSEIVSAALDQEQIRLELGVQALQGEKVGADVLTDGGVGAATGFDGDDAVGAQGAVLGEELGVLACEDVVGHGRDVVFLAQRQAQLQHQSRLPGPDGPTDPNREGPVGEVSPVHDGHLAMQVRAWSVEDVVRMAMSVGGIEGVRGV